MSDAVVTLGDIVAARRRLRPHLEPTPLRESPWLQAVTGARVALKLESVQLTQSFKIRGALNAMLRVDRSQHATVVTASAGNHGRALALAGERLGVRTVVFTPSTAPATKKAAIVRHGAELRDDAPDYDDAERRARAFAAETGALFISPYNHRDVIAGAGTVALEVLERMPDFDVIVVPIGGGGLASGIGVALKHAAPHVEVVGVEATASRPFAASLARGAITVVDVQPSLADGLTGNLEPGSPTFGYIRRHVDRLVDVGEDQLRAAVRGLAAEEHLLVEGAGAAATAALLAGITAPHPSRPVAWAGRSVVAIVSGANIDLSRFREVLETDGR